MKKHILAVAAMATVAAPAFSASTYIFRKVVPGIAVSPNSGASSPATGGNQAPTDPPSGTPALTKEAETSASSIDFGYVDVGEGNTKKVLLSNIGTGPISISDILIEGGSFQANTGCGATLASLATCETNVTFSPKSNGAETGKLSFQTNATAGRLEVALSGIGLQGILALEGTPNTDFGSVLTVTSSASRVITFKNTGNKAISGLAPTVSGADVSIAGSTCGTTQAPFTLGAGQSCSVTVQYAPKTKGALSQASISFGSISTTLTGAGVAPQGELTATPSFNFGDVPVGRTAYVDLTYRNTGDGAAQGINPKILGTGLSLSNNTCGTSFVPVTIAPNGTCSVRVTWGPTALGSLSSASMTIDSSHPDGKVTKALTGNAVEAPPAAADYMLLLHGEGAQGSTTVVDSALSRNPGEIAGTLSIDTATKAMGNASIKIVGSSGVSGSKSYIKYNAVTGGNRPFAFGTGDFTIDLSYRTSSFGCYGTRILSFGSQTSSTFDPAWTLRTNSAGQLIFEIKNSGGTNLFSMTSSAGIGLNNWAHVGVSRKGNSFGLFINGTKVSSGTYSGGTEWNADFPMFIGNPVGSGCVEGTSYYDEVRVLKGYGMTSLPVPASPYAP